MIFALATDEQTLYVFKNEDDAVAHCEGFDVESGLWLFWDDTGAPMEAKFTVPTKQGRITIQHGIYHLVASLDEQRKHLSDSLGHLSLVEGIDELTSIEAIERYLAQV